MVHYLLLKFVPGYDIDQVTALAERTYSQIATQVSGVTSVRVFRNCVVRDSNADLLIQIELESENALGRYLEHELHKAFVVQTHDHVVQLTTFDSL